MDGAVGSQASADGEGTPAVVAFYLPQFHPVPENDEWWGRGFTEWTNVSRARPLFRGHEQPRIPSELGYYDLRSPETRQAQSALAAEHGIDGFCYWHYWFLGRRLLERPFDEVRRRGEPGTGFCLAWANEAWTRVWDGSSQEVLLGQAYSPEDDVDHARWLVDVWADPRHLTVDQRPLFLVYRPADLPCPRRTTDTFREAAGRAGLPEPYLVGIDAWCPGRDVRDLGFDATLLFEPQLSVLARRMRSFAGRGVTVWSEERARARMSRARASAMAPTVPCVFVGWDNSPRRGRGGVVIRRRDTRSFRSALQGAWTDAHTAPGPPLLFLNAWNEWGEGNYLEPDVAWGRSLLEVVRTVTGGEQ